MEIQNPFTTAPLITAAGILVVAGFFGGFILGTSLTGRDMLPAAVAQTLGVDSPPEWVDFSPVWKAWAVMDEKFVPASVPTTTSSTSEPVIAGTPEEKRVYGMIQGLAESLGDPYAYFLPRVERERFQDDL